MKAGLGIRSELFDSIEKSKPEFGFFEAHSENYFGESIGRAKLLDLRQDKPISLHGVGLSLGRADNLDQHHLAQLKQLVDEVEPMLVSEHLAWSAYSHRHVPDLLPLPLTSQALSVMCEHIDQMQTALRRQILIENPSNYLLFEQLQIPEPEFLNLLAQKTGCGLLMDINNIHVSAINVGRNSKDYISAINSAAIGQYHLAGYTEVIHEHQGIDELILIDTHNQPVHEPVWGLFEYALRTHGARPTLIEWDSDFPELTVLEQECHMADALIDSVGKVPVTATHIKPVSLCNATQGDTATLVDAQCQFLGAVLNAKQALACAVEWHDHRIWVYQNNVFASLQDYLAGVYPSVKGVVGDEFFKQTADLFIQKYPPSEGNIHQYGAQFGDFCLAIDDLSSLTYLFDLTCYEWCLHSAYFSAVSGGLNPASVPQETLLTCTVQYNDSVKLVSSHYPIYQIHQQSHPDYKGEVSVNLNQSQDNILVYKNGHIVESLVISSEQYSFMQEISKHGNLLQAIEALQGSIEAEVLSATLSLIFDAKLITMTEN